jgi:hypothetical protein
LRMNAPLPTLLVLEGKRMEWDAPIDESAQGTGYEHNATNASHGATGAGRHQGD